MISIRNGCLELQVNNNIKLFQAVINNKLNEYIPLQYPETLWDAIRYSVLGSGKRLRGILCIESCETFNSTQEVALPLACSIEIIHAQSLIHDDLPCMDNDDYRRGKLSTHKKYGEATAVLAGDAMIPLAYEIFLKYTPDSISEKIKVKIIEEFSHTAGASGLVGGQSVDCEYEGKIVDKETLKYIHSHKTGALYRFSLRSGAILAGCSDNELETITNYAEAIGLAFQISDDILDITGSKDKLGKTPGKDKASGKNTYPLLYGFDNSISELKRLCELSKEILYEANLKSEVLFYLADYIRDRIK